ncbi:hypothetical protein V496_03722 [Pseudogymnoascus sp. VKM F-4515 (FW-2607)]|nr:hypothetical protein V496_03722 [Pseudogymnoascus sp. VKM F-4515 (FW-2607)]KFY91130.1 hypothetical protein V498_05636 [Pseudogymnoascus sp. VKM F-4517 (FW-2822)]
MLFISNRLVVVVVEFVGNPNRAKNYTRPSSRSTNFLSPTHLRPLRKTIRLSRQSCKSSLRGGAKKRKKKVYTTPKKIKHKRKKTKLAVLKYYKVDGDGKIERLRRECPTPDCGAGVFMAAMHDRQYCGRCHLTYIFDNENKA